MPCKPGKKQAWCKQSAKLEHCGLVDASGSAGHRKTMQAEVEPHHGAYRNEATMGTLSDRAKAKMSAPSWDRLRKSFDQVNDALLKVSEEAFGELTTIYIKYSISK